MTIISRENNTQKTKNNKKEKNLQKTEIFICKYSFSKENPNMVHHVTTLSVFIFVYFLFFLFLCVFCFLYDG